MGLDEIKEKIETKKRLQPKASIGETVAELQDIKEEYF